MSVCVCVQYMMYISAVVSSCSLYDLVIVNSHSEHTVGDTPTMVTHM